MKLLLTSGGITNPTLEKALRDLVGRDFKNLKAVAIISASNAEGGNKDWVIKDLVKLQELGFEVDILMLAGLTKPMIMQRLEAADLIFGEGGNAYYFMEQLLQADIAKEMPKLLESRVYVGASAGSQVTTKYLATDVAPIFGEREETRTELARHLDAGLGFVDFYFKPHLNAPDFPDRTVEWATRIAEQVDFPVYFLDDDSAIKVDGDNIEIVSEGTWKCFN